MKLEDFRRLWEEDGFHLTETERKEKGGFYYLLLRLKSDQSTEEYGRHGAILMKVEKATGEIDSYDTMNLAGDWQGNTPYTLEVQEWFERHVGL